MLKFKLLIYVSDSWEISASRDRFLFLNTIYIILILYSKEMFNMLFQQMSLRFSWRDAEQAGKA